MLRVSSAFKLEVNNSGFSSEDKGVLSDLSEWKLIPVTKTFWKGMDFMTEMSMVLQAVESNNIKTVLKQILSA